MERGQFVLSIAGRDRNRIFIINDVIDDDYILIADGMLRSINKPKKKKLKHVRVINDITGLDVMRIESDKDLAAVIKAASNSYREKEDKSS